MPWKDLKVATEIIIKKDIYKQHWLQLGKNTIMLYRAVKKDDFKSLAQSFINLFSKGLL